MPAQVQKSSLFARHGDRVTKALQKAAVAPIDTGERMPGGVTNGVAELEECKFVRIPPGKKNAGMVQFQATGVALSPESVMVDGTPMRVAGKQTRIYELCEDTVAQNGNKTSLEEHLFVIANHMKLLAGDANFIAQDAEGSDLEEYAKQLEEADPPIRFRFSTELGKATKEFPNPRVWERWHGSEGLQDWQPSDAVAPSPEAAVQDSTKVPSKARPSTNGSQSKAPVNRVVGKVAPKAAPVEEPDNSDDNADGVMDDAPTDNSEVSIEDLVELADGEDKDAIVELCERAMNLGIEQETIDNVETWQEVADMIASAEDNARQGVSNEPEAAELQYPAVGDEFHKRMPDQVNPKTKKKIPGKLVKCVVKKVHAKTSTLDMTSEDGKLILKGVPWAELLNEDGEAIYE